MYSILLHNFVVHIGESDCPVFEGLFNFAQISCGASIDSAVMLNNDDADICINWAGKGLGNNRRTASCKERRSRRILLCK